MSKDTIATLVERLRSCHCGPRADADDGHRIDCRMRREAADEIERLRTDLVFWENDGSEIDAAKAEIERLKAENARLRHRARRVLMMHTPMDV